MREIKFRAWTGLEMEYRVVVGQLGAFYASGIDPKDTACIENTTIYSKKTPIMQYTGLKDKNGKEIYEGDIIRWNEENMEVFFDEDCPGYYVILNGLEERLFSRRMKHFEIIGNIYENPEMIEAD